MIDDWRFVNKIIGKISVNEKSQTTMFIFGLTHFYRSS